jgi:hypothetical protein
MTNTVSIPIGFAPLDCGYASAYFGISEKGQFGPHTMKLDMQENVQ